MQLQEDRSVDNIWMKKYNYRQQIARLKVLQITDTKKGRNTDNRWIQMNSRLQTTDSKIESNAGNRQIERQKHRQQMDIDEQQTIENRQQD